VPGFRYSQFCPLARAAELIGERWTLLLVRELLLGPKRFSDLRRGLSGVSSSVLSERLAALERAGLVVQRELPPPTPASLYELTEAGLGLEPALLELARFGLRFLGAPQPGDHYEPDWLRLALRLFARERGSPARCFRIELRGGVAPVHFRVQGGPEGTRVLPAEGPADASLESDSALAVLAVAAGRKSPAAALADGSLRASGDLASLAEFPALFDLRPRGVAPELGAGS